MNNNPTQSSEFSEKTNEDKTIFKKLQNLKLDVSNLRSSQSSTNEDSPRTDISTDSFTSTEKSFIESPVIDSPVIHSTKMLEGVNLTPKSDDKMNTKKEKQKLKAQFKLEKKKMKREAFMKKSAEVFLKEIIPNWQTQLRSKRAIKYWKKGLPSRVRGKVWELAIGNDLRMTEDYFQILLKKEIPKDIETKSHLSREDTIYLIDIDVSRTFPTLQFFQKGGPLNKSLQDVLECYVKMRPDVGYVQGMSYLVAMLLLNMETYNAFKCLANMLSKDHFFQFFRMDTCCIAETVETVKILMKDFLPNLCKHFEKVGVKYDPFVMDWFITLFSKSFNIDIAARLWDLYFLEGEVFLYKATLGILKYNSKVLHGSFDEIMKFLSQMPKDLDESKLFKCINKIKLTPKKLQQAKLLAQQKVSQSNQFNV